MNLDAPGYRYMAIDGIENCISALKDIENGNIHHAFIEMSSCVGSCVGGPVMEKYHPSPVREYIAVAEYAGDKDFVVEQPDSNDLRKHFSLIERENKMPSEYEINAALRQMGKMSKRDELNCGSCGYNTCREKAIAICQGKAEASMCLPYLQKKAEGFSDRIVNNTPNGIIVLNDSLEVQQINEAAMDIMNIRSSSDVLGEQVVRIMDPAVFYEVQKKKFNVHNRRVYLAEYKDTSNLPSFTTPTITSLSALCATSPTRKRERKEREYFKANNRNGRQSRGQANAHSSGNRVFARRNGGGNKNRAYKTQGVHKR